MTAPTLGLIWMEKLLFLPSAGDNPVRLTLISTCSPVSTRAPVLVYQFNAKQGSDIRLSVAGLVEKSCGRQLGWTGDKGSKAPQGES